MEELKLRDIAIAADNPAGGYAEALVCRGLGLERQRRGHPGFDGLDRSAEPAVRYQIKGRRNDNDRVHTGPLPNIGRHQFDHLVMVIFNTDFTVRRADKIPYCVVREAWEAWKRKGSSNNFIFQVTNAVRADSRVKNITDLLPDGAD